QQLSRKAGIDPKWVAKQPDLVSESIWMSGSILPVAANWQQEVSAFAPQIQRELWLRLHGRVETNGSRGHCRLPRCEDYCCSGNRGARQPCLGICGLLRWQ